MAEDTRSKSKMKGYAMSNPGKSERIQEIIRRRLYGEPVSSIAADIGISRTYIYSVLSLMPKAEKPGMGEAEHSSFSPGEDFSLVMDYLSIYPSRQITKNFGKDQMDEAVIQKVAEMNNVSVAQVKAALHRVTAPHPMVSDFPLYSRVGKWKRDNLVSMRELAGYADVSVQKMNLILKGMAHMPLETAKRIKKRSGLSIYEIYYDLIEIEREQESREEPEVI